MTTALATTNGNGQIDDRSLLTLVSDGDCSKLSEAQKLAYYRARCDAAGLDYRAQPFQFVRLNSKLVLYALKACSDQLAAKHGIKTHILSQESTADGLRIVTVRATTKDGRETDEIGAVSIKGLSGETLANALMKAATKAKRRAVLSVCGLGMLDETEIETIPRAQPVRVTIKDDAETADDQLEENLRKSVKNGAATHKVAEPVAVGAPPPAEQDKLPESQPQVETPGQIAGRLIAAIAKIDNEHHYANWKTKHWAEVQALPPMQRKAVEGAYNSWAP